MFVSVLFIIPNTKNFPDVHQWVNKQTEYSTIIHTKPRWVSRECWIKNPNNCILYNSTYRTFLRWENCTHGEEIDDHQNYRQDGAELLGGKRT